MVHRLWHYTFEPINPTLPQLSCNNADGGYFETALTQAAELGLNLQPVLVPPGHKGFVVVPKRWVVERTFAWLSRCRRLDREYEVRVESSQTLILLAMSRLMLNRLAPV